MGSAGQVAKAGKAKSSKYLSRAHVGGTRCVRYFNSPYSIWHNRTFHHGHSRYLLCCPVDAPNTVCHLGYRWCRLWLRACILDHSVSEKAQNARLVGSTWFGFNFGTSELLAVCYLVRIEA